MNEDSSIVNNIVKMNNNSDVQVPTTPGVEHTINNSEMETDCQESVQDSHVDTVNEDLVQQSDIFTDSMSTAIHNSVTDSEKEPCQNSISQSEVATVCMETANCDSLPNLSNKTTCQKAIQQSEVATIDIATTNVDSSPDLESETAYHSIQQPDTALGNNPTSSLNSKPLNDDIIFIKPQTTYIRGKQKKPQDTATDINITQSTSTMDIYDNPIPSSSKTFEETILQTNNPNTEENKTLPDAEENVSQSFPPVPKRDTNIHEVICLKKRVELFAPESGPQMYVVKGNLVTRPIITKNLPEIFQYLPVCGKPGSDMNLQHFQRNKIRQYVGCDLDDDDFNDLENYCNPDLLKTGHELQIHSSVPIMGVLNTNNIVHNNFSTPDTNKAPPNLITLKKNKIRNDLDVKRMFVTKLKYRGIRILPFTQEAKNNKEKESQQISRDETDVELNPGEDILYRVRIYRPYSYTFNRDRFTRPRHSIFSCDIVLTGRHKLTALRDRFVCHNDFDMRVDVSEHPDSIPNTKAKDLFPSGFLFINNVFYVDTRPGCIDYSAPIREWAIKRKLGDYPKKDMCQVKLQDLVLKLGYPEVYVHQGNCEHVFVFSEIRLLGPTDPLRFSNYPCTTTIAQNQTVYCTTCAEFSAKWIVVGSDRVPFDPGFLCDTCFKQYMYVDGKKIGNFKAYSYRGNALNVLKP